MAEQADSIAKALEEIDKQVAEWDFYPAHWTPASRKFQKRYDG